MRQFIPAFFLILALFAVPAIAQAEQYTCPMHPHYVADRPGTCPICGMDLVELEGEDDGAAMESMDKSDKGGMERTTVTIDPETIQNTGIRTEEAQLASFGTLVRSYGDVTENVRLQFDISARVEGWVEDLKVQAMGDEVKEGDLWIAFECTQGACIETSRCPECTQLRRRVSHIEQVQNPTEGLQA